MKQLCVDCINHFAPINDFDETKHIFTKKITIEELFKLDKSEDFIFGKDFQPRHLQQSDSNGNIIIPQNLKNQICSNNKIKLIIEFFEYTQSEFLKYSQ